MQVDFQMAWHDGTDWGEWGSAPRQPLVQFDAAHRGEWLDSVIGKHPATGCDMIYHVIRCEMCILTHVWPIPNEDDLEKYYTREFYELEKPDMITRYEEDAEWWAKCMHGPTLDVATTLLSPSVSVPCLLDIGAGPGLLLRNAAARGWHTQGIEPSPLCVERLKNEGHSVWQGSLTSYIHDSGFSEKSYDIVTMWETIEHVINPEETLLQVWQLLRPHGVLVLCVPNEYTQAQRDACKKFNLPSWWLAPPQHLSYMTPKTLQLLTRRCGFTQRYLRMTYPLIETFMLERGLNYVTSPAMGRGCHRERMRQELEAVARGYWPQMEARYIANVETRVGREIVGIWTKEGG